MINLTFPGGGGGSSRPRSDTTSIIRDPLGRGGSGSGTSDTASPIRPATRTIADTVGKLVSRKRPAPTAAPVTPVATDTALPPPSPDRVTPGSNTINNVRNRGGAPVSLTEGSVTVEAENPLNRRDTVSREEIRDAGPGGTTLGTTQELANRRSDDVVSSAAQANANNNRAVGADQLRGAASDIDPEAIPEPPEVVAEREAARQAARRRRFRSGASTARGAPARQAANVRNTGGARGVDTATTQRAIKQLTGA